MKIWLIRHGETQYNKEHRYQGRHDVPLSEEGKMHLVRCREEIDKVYVSPLKRAVQTVEIIFPDARLIRVPGLTEMNFGAFEGHTYEELGSYPPYQAWIDSGGKAQIPGGESREQFSSRVISTLSDLIAHTAEGSPETDRKSEHDEKLVIVAHGGTIMAAMERLGKPQGLYFEWMLPNGMGYEIDTDDPDALRRLDFTVSCNKMNSPV